MRGGLMANLLEIAGRETLSQLDYVGSLNIQLWATLRGMHAALPLVGNRHRWRAAVHQMLEIGVQALPMVALLAMCSGFILAMQGASELRRFGALPNSRLMASPATTGISTNKPRAMISVAIWACVNRQRQELSPTQSSLRSPGAIIITCSNSLSRGSGTPNHYVGDLLHTIAISGRSRV
jgi:hypothetical protein